MNLSSEITDPQAVVTINEIARLAKMSDMTARRRAVDRCVRCDLILRNSKAAPSPLYLESRIPEIVAIIK